MTPPPFRFLSPQWRCVTAASRASWDMTSLAAAVVASAAAASATGAPALTAPTVTATGVVSTPYASARRSDSWVSPKGFSPFLLCVFIRVYLCARAVCICVRARALLTRPEIRNKANLYFQTRRQDTLCHPETSQSRIALVITIRVCIWCDAKQQLVIGLRPAGARAADGLRRRRRDSRH